MIITKTNIMKNTSTSFLAFNGEARASLILGPLVLGREIRSILANFFSRSFARLVKRGFGL